MLNWPFALIALLVVSVPASAGPGHDHGHDAGPAMVAPDIPRLESASADIELVATAQGRTLTIFLDRFATNEPVSGAAIEVSGEGIAPLVAKPLPDGVYEIEADWVAQHGTKALIFTVTGEGIAELLNGTLSIPEAGRVHDVAAVDLGRMLAVPVFWGVLLGALALGFVLALAFRPRGSAMPATAEGRGSTAANGVTSSHIKHAAEVIAVAALACALISQPLLAGPGHDHGDGGHGEAAAAPTGNVPRKLPDGSVFVPKTSQRLLQVRTKPAAEDSAPTGRELIGTVIPDPASFGHVQAPMDGRIDVGERGVSYIGQRIEAGEVLAYLAPTIPVADLGTMQQLRAEVEGKLKIAEQRLARLTRIAGVIAQRDIDDTRAELDALREQKRVLAPKDVERFALTAPVSGIISVANVRAGQVVSARDTLFEIVDPARLWIEAVSTAAYYGEDITSATAIDADRHTIRISFIGKAPTLRQQSQPLLFRIDEVHEGLGIGAAVKVLAQGRSHAKGIVLPETAVVRGLNGLPQVWTKVSAERFEPVPVRTQALDGTHLLIEAGVRPGDRVVTTGAELINQIR